MFMLTALEPNFKYMVLKFKLIALGVDVGVDLFGG